MKAITTRNVLVLSGASAEPLVIDPPRPDQEKRGNLASHPDLKSFRIAAWKTGVRFKIGLGI